MPSNEQVNFVFKVSDDHTNQSNMLVNQLSISDDVNDFDNAYIVTAVFFDSNYNVWIIPVNTAVFQSGTTYYLRYTINDGENIENTTFPNDQTSYIYKSMWSFIVQ